VAVDDSVIAEARVVLALDGLGCEPASAASLAGARLLRDRKTIGKDDEVVVLLTGSGLKDPASAISYHRDPGHAYANAPTRIDADVRVVARELEALA
jgi:threonine synthase